MENKNKYICLICDIIRSTFLKNEHQLDTIPEVLEKMNSELKPLVSFQVVSGDEFQGLLRIDQQVFKFINFLEYHLFPLRFRTGIGISTISTDIKTNTRTMRGNVFILARKAINQAHKKKCLYFIESDHEIEGIGTILNLMGFIKNQWKESLVFRRFYLYDKYKSTSKVAELESVSLQAINKVIRNYGMREIQLAIQYIYRAISKSTL